MKKSIIAFILTALLLITALFSAALAESAEGSLVLRTDLVELREEWQSAEDPAASEVITFEILDETNAVLTDRVIESDHLYNDTVRTGTYKLTELGYEFLSPQPYGENEWYSCVVVLDKIVPGRIEGVTYEYLDYSLKELAGTYTGTSEVFGEAVLEVSEVGKALLKTQEGGEIVGTLSAYNEGYDFFANIGEGPEEAYEDYYVTLSGSTYTLRRFAEVTYEAYAGSFTAVGDLGELTFTVSEEGVIETDAVIGGEKARFTGVVYTDDEQQRVSGCWMSDERGMILYLLFETFEDGTVNYYGTLETQLAAG